MKAIGPNDQVIMLPVIGKIFMGVINDMVCPNGAHHGHFARTAYPRNFCSKHFGYLHGKSTYASGCTIDQYLLSCLNLSFVAKSLQGCECR